jgi:tetratricopeptide (TPR) repeat protein
VVLHQIDPQSAKVVAEPLRSEEKPSVSAKLQLGTGSDMKNPGRIQRAATALLRALNTPNFSAYDAYALAKTYWQNDLATLALSETEVALSKDPSQLESWVLRSEIFARTSLHRQSLEALEKADSIYQTAKDRTFAYSRDEVLAALAAEQTNLGKDEEALGAYLRISDPTRYFYRMAIAAEHVGRLDEARGWLEKVAAAGTNESEAARSRLEQEPYRKKP